MIHQLSDVQSKNIGSDTLIWQYTVVLPGAKIGNNCNINCHTFIENDVVIGNNVTVKSGIYLWDGITIEDDVFLGPNVVFTNDLYPRSKKRQGIVRTLLKQGASIGANSSILAGITIGKYALLGMGSVLTKDVPDYGLYYGQPATFKGWVDECGNKLVQVSENAWVSPNGQEFILSKNGKLKKKE